MESAGVLECTLETESGAEVRKQNICGNGRTRPVDKKLAALLSVSRLHVSFFLFFPIPLERGTDHQIVIINKYFKRRPPITYWWFSGGSSENKSTKYIKGLKT